MSHARRRSARPWIGAVALVLGASAFAACGSEEPVRRDCFARIWVSRAEPTRIAMEVTDWKPGLLATPYDDTWSLFRLELPPGEYGYLLDRGGREVLDPRNPLTTYRDTGEEVSLLVVDDCDVPAIAASEPEVSDGRIDLSARFLAARSAAPIDPATVRAETRKGGALRVESVDEQQGTFRVHGEVGEGRTTISITASDTEGTAAEGATVRVWPSRRAPERSDEVLYQVVVDRYRGDGGAALAPPPTSGARAGGTLDGVRAAIDDGTFDRLGVSSLWLSPVYDNPDEARPTRDGRMVEGYHGYWVQDGRRVEPRIGGEAALRAVVEAAHDRGIAVLLDIVPNHVDETNPTVARHQGDDWFNPTGCVCGTEGCPWGENLQVCWFADYLPDLHLQNPDVTHYEVDEARFWVTELDVDGVRIDAVPMMPRGATRRIVRGVRDTITAGEAPFVVGEVFTGPGTAALEEIRAQIGPSGLGSAFAFPLMWALRAAIASRTGGFADVESLLAAEEERFAGSGVIVGRILDNHDVSRFVSVANGDDGGDPWTEPARQPTDAAPYERMAIGLTAIFGLPGMPTVFQGDEVGLAGSGDPDNRRVMPADDDLAEEQLLLRAHTERLGALRRCSKVLRRGDRRPLVAEVSRWAFARTDGDDAAIVVLGAGDTETTLVVPVPPDTPVARWVDALSGESFDLGASGALAVTLPARSSRILLPADDPCAQTPPDR